MGRACQVTVYMYIWHMVMLSDLSGIYGNQYNNRSVHTPCFIMRYCETGASLHCQPPLPELWLHVSHMYVHV